MSRMIEFIMKMADQSENSAVLLPEDTKMLAAEIDQIQARLDEAIGVIAWMQGRGAGMSSQTIVCVMIGVDCTAPSVPYDSGDFGRCFLLLERFPLWRERLSEVADCYPEWTQIVAKWDEISEHYLREDHSAV